jgi:hypothetical protein
MMTLISEEGYDGYTFLQDEVTCNIKYKAGIPKCWFLLESKSTVDEFMNNKLHKNICDAKNPLSYHCNVGEVSVTKIGDLTGYVTVCYYKR